VKTPSTGGQAGEITTDYVHTVRPPEEDKCNSLSGCPNRNEMKEGENPIKAF